MLVDSLHKHLSSILLAYSILFSSVPPTFRVSPCCPKKSLLVLGGCPSPRPPLPPRRPTSWRNTAYSWTRRLQRHPDPQPLARLTRFSRKHHPFVRGTLGSTSAVSTSGWRTPAPIASAGELHLCTLLQDRLLAGISTARWLLIGDVHSLGC